MLKALKAVDLSNVVVILIQEHRLTAAKDETSECPVGRFKHQIKELGFASLNSLCHQNLELYLSGVAILWRPCLHIVAMNEIIPDRAASFPLTQKLSGQFRSSPSTGPVVVTRSILKDTLVSYMKSCTTRHA